MKGFCAVLLLLLLTGLCGAQGFDAPQAYPIDRYEQGWSKNPFTLKTAPVAIQHDSFAKDLVLGSICQIGDAIKVIIINTKTRARTPLYNSGENAGGMSIKAVHLDESRKGTYVEIAAGDDSAILRYDASVLKQFAAPGAAGQPKNPMPGGTPPPLPGTTAAAKNPVPSSAGTFASASPSGPIDATTQAIVAQMPARMRQRQMNLRYPGGH